MDLLEILMIDPKMSGHYNNLILILWFRVLMKCLILFMDLVNFNFKYCHLSLDDMVTFLSHIFRQLNKKF